MELPVPCVGQRLEQALDLVFGTLIVLVLATLAVVAAIGYGIYEVFRPRQSNLIRAQDAILPGSNISDR